MYEYHVTVAKPGTKIRDWKETQFTNVDYMGDVVREDVILTDHFETFNGKQFAIGNLFETVERYLGYEALRIKVEGPLDTRPFQSLYYEAHFKMSEPVKSIHGHHSINRLTGSHWYSIRTTDYARLVRDARIFKDAWSSKIVEQEIESVFVDTNPEIDYSWMEI